MTLAEYAEYTTQVATSGSGTAVTGNKPSGASTGTLCIAFIFTDSSSSSISARPTGWANLEVDPSGTGSDMSGFMDWKILGAGEGASWEWTLAATAGWHVVVVSVLLINTTSPFADSAVAEENAVDNSLAITSAALNVNKALVITCGAVDASGAARTWTNDDGSTEAYDAMLQQLHISIYYKSAVDEFGQTHTSGPLVVTGSNQYMIVFQVCVRGALHNRGGITFAPGNTNAWMHILYDPGTQVVKYLEFGNEFPPSVGLEVEVTDGTTTWTGTVYDAPVGSEATIDTSAGNITTNYDTATQDFVDTNLNITYLKLNP